MNLDNYTNVEAKTIIAMLCERKKIMEKQILAKQKALSHSPEGSLRVLSKKTFYQYYYRTDPKDTNGKYIDKDNIALAKKLAQRDYDKKIKQLAEKEYKLIDGYLRFSDLQTMDDVFEGLHPARKALTTPVIIPDNEYIQNWLNISYEPMGFDELSGNFYSVNGVRVRSKSEVLIANMLEHYNVPYHYEYPLTLNGKQLVRPDFYCLNVSKRKEFAWEHFGMMDNIAYANKNISKIELYGQSGYYAGKNFIMTFESSLHPIDSNIIREMILEYLV